MKNHGWRLLGNERSYIDEVLSQGFRAGADGAFSTKFESAVASSYGVKYAIAMNSGTSTLHAALLALGCTQGDEVLTPALTPLMCGLAPIYTGAIPVFVDSEYDTFLMDPNDLEEKITKHTKVIMVTHMYGGVCNMEKIMSIAKKHQIPVLEDCAQCHYGIDNLGRYAGTIGDIGSWSYENSKHLTCGDGGVVSTNSELLAEKVRKFGGLGFKNLTAISGRVRSDREKLQHPDWERFSEIGFNYRMNQLAAAVALAQTERREYFIDLRQKMGQLYEKVIGKNELLRPQNKYGSSIHTYYTFSARFDGEQFGITWEKFRQKYIENGGDGFYAASKLQYQEPAFKNKKIGRCNAPTSEKLQKKLMNFTTNQENESERQIQAEAMYKTIQYFN
jgi:perosamine synthetase